MENFSNERLLQGARNLKAKGYSPEQVNAWLLTNGSSLDAMKEFATQQKNSLPQNSQDIPTLSLTDEQKAQIQANKDDYNRKGWLRLMEAIDDFNSGFGEGTVSGLERVANGATFGTYDDLVDGAKERKQKLQERADSVGVGGLNRAINKATEDAGTAWSLVGGGKVLKGTGILGKGVGKTSKVAQALLAPEMASIAPVAAGGFTEGAIDPESTIGKIVTNLGGGILFEGLRSIPKRTFQTFKTGLENIVNDTDALKIVRRGAKIDDDVAKNIVKSASETADNINQTSHSALRDLLDGATNQDRYKGVRDSYERFVDKNAHKKVPDLSLSRLNPYQTRKLKKALKEGLDIADYGTKEGTLGHLLSARQMLDEYINDSFRLEFPAKAATVYTEKLGKLRDKVDAAISKIPFAKGYDRDFTLYKKFSDAYQKGLKYSPGSPKNILDEILLSGGGDQEKAMMAKFGLKKGLFDKLSVDVQPDKNFSKVAKNYQNVLKKLLYPDQYESLMGTLVNNETAFNRLAKLVNTAENKLTTPEASRIFLREQYESPGAAKGALLDAILGRLSSGYYKKSAQKLLNGNGESVDILTSPAYQQVITNILKGNVRGLGANSRLISAKALADALKED